MRYELFLLRECISELGLNEQIVYQPARPIDFVWSYLGLWMEAKRLVKTKYVNRVWLMKNVVERFSEEAMLRGEEPKVKVVVVTQRKWDGSEELFLQSEGIRVIETGQIGTAREKEKAKEAFIEGFSDLVWEICTPQVLEVKL